MRIGVRKRSKKEGEEKTKNPNSKWKEKKVGGKKTFFSPSSSCLQSCSALSSADSDLAACAAATADSASTSLPAKRTPAFAATSPGTSAASPIITLHSSMCLSADAAFLRCWAVSCVAAVSAVVPSPVSEGSEVEETAPDIGAKASKAS